MQVGSVSPAQGIRSDDVDGELSVLMDVEECLAFWGACIFLYS